MKPGLPVRVAVVAAEASEEEVGVDAGAEAEEDSKESVAGSRLDF
jgi:hypothetical protein